MDIGSIFGGFIGFVIEEAIAVTFCGVLWISLNSAIRNANATGFANVVPLLYFIFVFILLIPVIHHLGDIRDSRK